MASEAIGAIKRAEQTALEIEHMANQKAAEILENARKKAEEIVAQACDTARREVEQKLEADRKLAKEASVRAKEASVTDQKQMVQKAADRKKQAIHLIVSEVI